MLCSQARKVSLVENEKAPVTGSSAKGKVAFASFLDADRYEQLMGRWSRRLAPSLIQFGGLHDGDRVLDMGLAPAV